MSHRLGIFGGMFDPIHQGHYKAAVFALEELQLDKLKLVPCHIPNHRDGAVASPDQRVRMLELAIDGHSKIEIETAELERDGVSYMLDTLSHIARDNNNSSLVLVLGLDSFNSLPSWHRFEEMSEKCHLLVLSRPGASLNDIAQAQVAQHWTEKQSAEELFSSESGNFLLANNESFNLSSTTVRKAIDKGETLQGLVAESVADYIASQSLYGSRN